MQTTHCAWCNREAQFFDKTESSANLEHYICSNCLIPLLPKTLVTQKEKSAKDQPPEERRTHERYPVLSKVYLTSSTNTAKIVKILVLDISDTGMKIQIGEQLKADEEITLGFMGEEIVYKALGKVKYLNETQVDQQPVYQFGIQLTGIHQDLRAF